MPESPLRMQVSRWFRLAVVIGMSAGFAPLPAAVAAAPLPQANLLTNPGFEDGWYNWNNIGELAIPNGWDFWWANENVPMLVPQDSPWGRPETVTWLYPADYAETFYWRDGQYTLKVFGAWRPIWFRLSQTVTGLTPGAEYRFVAPIFPESVHEYSPEGIDGRIFSDDPLAGEFKLDATTGGQTFSSGWQDERTVPVWQWTLLTLTFVAQSDTATVQVEVRGRWGLVNNAFFIDQLSLTPTDGIGGGASEPTSSASGAAATSGFTSTPGPSPTPPPSTTPIWGYTSTPRPDGEVWWEVRSGDTLAIIAYYHNTTADAIKELNGLTSDTIFPGQRLLIRRVTPQPESTTTPAPTITLAPSQTLDASLDSGQTVPLEVAAAPAASANTPAYGEVCVLAYNDVNGNAENDGERVLDGAHIVLIDQSGPLDSRTSGQNGEAECFQRLAPGAYRVTVLAPDGYRLTTGDASDVVLQAGTIITLAFGLGPAENVSAEVTPTRTTTLYALGAGVLLLLVAGVVGLSLKARRRR